MPHTTNLDNLGVVTTHGHLRNPTSLAHRQPHASADVCDEMAHEIRSKPDHTHTRWQRGHPEKEHVDDDGTTQYDAFSFDDWANYVVDAMATEASRVHPLRTASDLSLTFRNPRRWHLMDRRSRSDPDRGVRDLPGNGTRLTGDPYHALLQFSAQKARADLHRLGLEAQDSVLATHDRYLTGVCRGYFGRAEIRRSNTRRMLGMDPTLADNRHRWKWDPKPHCPACERLLNEEVLETHTHRVLDCIGAGAAMAAARLRFRRSIMAAAQRLYTSGRSTPMAAAPGSSHRKHVLDYLGSALALNRSGSFSAEGTNRDDALRICSGLIPHRLRQAISLDDPDQSAGLRLIRLIGKVARQLNARLRRWEFPDRERDLSDMAPSSLGESDSSDGDQSEGTSSSSDGSTSHTSDDSGDDGTQPGGIYGHTNQPAPTPRTTWPPNRARESTRTARPNGPSSAGNNDTSYGEDRPPPTTRKRTRQQTQQSTTGSLGDHDQAQQRAPPASVTTSPRPPRRRSPRTGISGNSGFGD